MCLSERTGKMNRRKILATAAALAILSAVPAMAAGECTTENAFGLVKMISQDMVLEDVSPSEALELIGKYLTYCKEEYPGFDYTVVNDGLGYSVFMKVADEPNEFHVIRTRWLEGPEAVTVEELFGEMPHD